jgi:hypothetical protein
VLCKKDEFFAQIKTLKEEIKDESNQPLQKTTKYSKIGENHINIKRLK